MFIPSPNSNPKWYDVRVSLPDGSTGTFIVISYDITSKHVGLEFAKRVWNLDESQVPNPGNRVYTFQQELRLLNSAAAAYMGARAIEMQIIDGKMKEAYGSTATVMISPHP